MPELPELPELPQIYSEAKKIGPLPRLPLSSLGEKFSQNAIKEAVSGKKEVQKEIEADEFAEDEMQMMHESLRTPLVVENSKEEAKRITKEIESHEVPSEFKDAARVVKRAEPVFVRIDKFEDSLRIFENAKSKILEIDKMLKDIKKLKESEETELNEWDIEIKKLKEQINKIDQEIFSKIE